MNERSVQYSTAEQRAYFDDHDTPEQREHGTKFLLDKLGLELQNE